MGQDEVSDFNTRKHRLQEEEGFPAPPPLPRERRVFKEPPPPPPLKPRGTDVGIRTGAASGAAPALPEPPPLPRSRLPAAPPPPPQAATKTPRLARQPEPPAPPQRAADRPPQRPRLPRRGPLFGFLALAVALVGALLFFALRNTESRPEESLGATQDEGSTPEATEPTSLADLIGGGALLVDARPWGRLSSVVDRKGEEMALPSDRQTPLVLRLGPGTYRVRLEHPELLGENSYCTAEVSEEAAGTCRLDLLPVDTEDYWEELGWWR